MVKTKSLRFGDVEISRLRNDENYNHFLLESPNYQNIANILHKVYFNPERANITRQEIEDCVSITNPSPVRDAYLVKLGDGSVVDFTIKNFDKFYEVDAEKTRDLAKEKGNYEENNNRGVSYAHDEALDKMVLKDGTFFNTGRRLFLKWKPSEGHVSKGNEYNHLGISLAPLDRIGIYDFLDNRPRKVDAEVGSPQNYLAMSLIKKRNIYQLGLGQATLRQHRIFFRDIGVEER